MISNWPYLAGILDGEGTVCANKRSQGDYQLQVAIYNTSATLMKWLIKHAGGRYYVRSYVSWNGKPGKIHYMWMPSGKKNKEVFLLGVLPHLVVKTEQAKLAVEFLRLPYNSPSERAQIAQLLHSLNRESVTTNTLEGSSETGESKIEPELTGDRESDPVVILDS